MKAEAGVCWKENGAYLKGQCGPLVEQHKYSHLVCGDKQDVFLYSGTRARGS